MTASTARFEKKSLCWLRILLLKVVRAMFIRSSLSINNNYRLLWNFKLFLLPVTSKSLVNSISTISKKVICLIFPALILHLPPWVKSKNIFPVLIIFFQDNHTRYELSKKYNVASKRIFILSTNPSCQTRLILTVHWTSCGEGLYYIQFWQIGFVQEIYNFSTSNL